MEFKKQYYLFEILDLLTVVDAYLRLNTKSAAIGCVFRIRCG